MMGYVTLKVVARIEDKGRLNSQLVCGNMAVLSGGIRYSVNECLDILFFPANVSQG